MSETRTYGQYQWRIRGWIGSLGLFPTRCFHIVAHFEVNYSFESARSCSWIRRLRGKTDHLFSFFVLRSSTSPFTGTEKEYKHGSFEWFEYILQVSFHTGLGSISRFRRIPRLKCSWIFDCSSKSPKTLTDTPKVTKSPVDEWYVFGICATDYQRQKFEGFSTEIILRWILDESWTIFNFWSNDGLKIFRNVFLGDVGSEAHITFRSRRVCEKIFLFWLSRAPPPWFFHFEGWWQSHWFDFRYATGKHYIFFFLTFCSKGYELCFGDSERSYDNFQNCFTTMCDFFSTYI